MINPGTAPVADARDDLAAANLDAFLTAVRGRGGRLVGAPVRSPGRDRDGRFGWDLPLGAGRIVQLLIPGTELDRVRGLGASAPCLYVDDLA